VEARDDHNPVLLNLKEYSVREAPHSRTSTAPVDDRKLHWMFRDCLKRRLDCQREPFPELGANVVIPTRTSSKSSFASGIQTTGSVTVS
jgi:hypothetical protein